MFYELVSNISTCVKLSILINGSPHKFFSFLLFSGNASRGLSRFQLDGLTKTNFARTGYISYSHVLYGSELFSFCINIGVTLLNLQGFLDRYGRDSTQIINKDKSIFYLGSISRHHKVVVEQYLGFKQGKVPFVYLRVQLFL